MVFDSDGNDALAKIAPQITPDSRVLELGSATGYFTEYMTTSLKCRVDCVELCQEMADRTKPFCQQMLVADLDKIALEDHFDVEAYDYIVIADVLEHLVAPQAVLTSCRKLLKPQGKLLLSVPNIAHVAVIGGLLRGEFNYTEEGLLDRTHLHFFTQKSLKNALTAANFSVDQLNAVVKLPEQTEIGDDYLDFSEVLQKALYNQPDALAYQFIVTASPCALNKYRHVELGLCSSEELASRRSSYVRKLTDQQQLLTTGLEKAEKLLEERTDALQSANEKVEALTIAFKQAEHLALERLAQIETLDKVLAEAQSFVRQREAEKGELEQTLEEINNSIFGKIYHRFNNTK